MLGVVDGSGGSARDEAARLRWGQPYTGPLCETEFRERWSIFMHTCGFVKRPRRTRDPSMLTGSEACVERRHVNQLRRTPRMVTAATSSRSR